MTMPNYLKTFREAVRKLETNEISPDLISFNSYPEGVGQEPESCDISDISDISGGLLSPRSLMSRPVALEKPFGRVFAALEGRCPDHVDPYRWQQCVEDAAAFLPVWDEQAEALGWTARDLFGLHTPPENPRPSYSRLSRYDCTGLIWNLDGRPVMALTADTVAIQNRDTGNVITYRKHHKPAFGPVGDSLVDFVKEIAKGTK
jgi:hypothetical protein